MMKRLGLFVVTTAWIAMAATAQEDYEPWINIQEGSVVCRQGILGPPGGGGPILSYDATLHDPRGNQVADHDKWTYSYRLDGQYSHEPLTSGIYTCKARFQVNGSTIGNLEVWRFINNCGANDERGEMIAEYHEHGVNYTPDCADFATSGGTANFSWSKLNGGFSNGNPHSPYGIVTGGLTSGLEATRTNYNRGGIRLTSGYRCPHGNAAVNGAAQSYHMQGRAADMYSASYAWTEAEFNLLKAAADQTGPAESFSWTTYTDRHYHASW